MPITYALLLCIPIGLLFYFEMRWAIRRFLGSFAAKERMAARLFGAYGALTIPLIYCSGLIGSRFAEKLQTTVTTAIFVTVSFGFLFPFLAVVARRRRN
jgi:hypothetical protein